MADPIYPPNPFPTPRPRPLADVIHEQLDAELDAATDDLKRLERLIEERRISVARLIETRQLVRRLIPPVQS